MAPDTTKEYNKCTACTGEKRSACEEIMGETAMRLSQLPETVEGDRGSIVARTSARTEVAMDGLCQMLELGCLLSLSALRENARITQEIN